MDAVDHLPTVRRGAEPHVERPARPSRPDADAALPRDHPAKPQLAEAHAERRLQRVSPPVSAVEPEQGECRKRHHGRDDGERGQRFHYPTIAGWRSSRRTGEARITSAWTRNPAAATTRQVSAPDTTPRSAPCAAPTGRAPKAVMLMADARPSSTRGVPVRRRVA